MTVSTELLFLIAIRLTGFYRNLPTRFFVFVIIANLISHPLAWLSYYGWVEARPEDNYFALTVVELGVVLFEGLIYYFGDFGSKLKLSTALWLSLLANSVTTFMGILLGR